MYVILLSILTQRRNQEIDKHKCSSQKNWLTGDRGAELPGSYLGYLGLLETLENCNSGT